jgi:hypothetical protein
MRKLLLAALACALLLAVAAVVADETIPPMQVGGGVSQTQTANGQTVEVSVQGSVVVVVFFSEVSSARVAGVARRVGGTTGTVTVRWVNQGRMTSMAIGPPVEVPFTMEGGDIDKRTGDYSE